MEREGWEKGNYCIILCGFMNPLKLYKRSTYGWISLLVEEKLWYNTDLIIVDIWLCLRRVIFVEVRLHN